MTGKSFRFSTLRLRPAQITCSRESTPTATSLPIRLLLFISRYSTGYLKPEVILKESFVLKETGMSRSSLYKAKKELLESGKITIGHTKAGNCVYRLAPILQCLKGATSARQRASQRWGSASSTMGVRSWRPHCNIKNIKKT